MTKWETQYAVTVETLPGLEACSTLVRLMCEVMVSHIPKPADKSGRHDWAGLSKLPSADKGSVPTPEDC